MGKRGGKKGGRGRGGFGKGGGGGNQYRRSERTNKADVHRHNEKYERYYNELGIITEDDKEDFWEAFRRDLPNSFRFTGSKTHALAVQQRLKDFYIPKITSITYEGEFVDAPQPVTWYPDQLAWFMTTPKNIIRRFPPFASFQKFLVAESDVGNISRQEVVSMIPPLVMDLKPGMTVLDLCAAPGSKSAQLIEMVHAGEEERTRKVATDLASGLDRPSEDEYADDGRSTGLLVANDVDYKRAHMLVHQMKRLSSPNIIVTNHDATVFPSIKLPSEPSTDGKAVPNRYLKFDRILADVPCSGDGTSRKNIEIWRTWTPSNGLGLHMTQVRILIRALQMLKVGGRVVYSTCSMNPVENEAVISHAIERCGGMDIVHILDTSNYLPGLKRHPGLKSWKVMDKLGRIWNSFQEVEAERAKSGDDGLGRLQEFMFPPDHDLPFERCMRVYPYEQDTGAFFIAILEKKVEIKARAEEKTRVVLHSGKEATGNSNGHSGSGENTTDGQVHESNNTEPKELSVIDSNQSVGKRKRNDVDEEIEGIKRSRLNDEEETIVSPLIIQDVGGFQGTDQLRDTPENRTTVAPEANETLATTSPEKPFEHQMPKQSITSPMPDSDAPYKTRKKLGQPFEEPFKYLDQDLSELEEIRKFYNINPRFPRDRFMVRNASGYATKNIYYTNALARSILQENEGKGMKFVHSGVKMFVKQDVPSDEVCPWRIQTDGLAILESWVGPERVVRLSKKATLRKLLIEMFPRFHGEEWKDLGEIGEQVRDIGMGCCVLRVEPSEAEDGLRERMVFPLWKSLHSLNLMLPKEDRRALLLRLFNDDSPLLNLTHKQQQKSNSANNGHNEKEDPEYDEQETRPAERNSSSPEVEVPEMDGVGAVEEEANDLGLKEEIAGTVE